MQIDDDMVAHVRDAIAWASKASPDTAKVSPAMVAAIDVMLQKGEALSGWRQSQLEILYEVRADTQYLHNQIREYAAQNGATDHVISLTGPLERSDGAKFEGFRFGLLCVIVDALQWPDTKLVYNLALGFPILGQIPDSGVYRRMDPGRSAADFETAYHAVMSENRAWLDEVDSNMASQAARALASRNTSEGRARYERMLKVQENTRKEVAADHLMSEGMTKAQLISRFTNSDGEFTARVMCRHGRGVEQGVKEVSPGVFEPKIRCIDDAARSLSNECTFMVETITTPNFVFPASILKEMTRQCAQRSIPTPGISVGCDDIWSADRTY